ncbi:MFS general substrate transporter [Pholiota conissans]|uniref:MFS general substrate transporter n=1 Tax=Pholiota conissans TaxID=109636 RepID=A0A9P5Z3V8_9AGAR|nr:MFS general substrate transporter [Pholiota conissans]
MATDIADANAHSSCTQVHINESTTEKVNGGTDLEIVGIADEKSPDLEEGRETEEPVDTRTPRQKSVSKLQFGALCWTLTLGGWNDGSTGALLPRIQRVYDIPYIILSLIFVFACAGFMAGSILNMYITPRLGFGRTLLFGSALQLIAYCIQSSAPPYPVFVLGYVISGMGISLQDAQANGFVASLKYNAISKMGIVHSAYGFGLLIAPFVSTQFAQQPHWSFHFLVSLGMSLSNTAFQFFMFRFKSLDVCLEEGGEPPVVRSHSDKGSLFSQVMKNWRIHAVAAFIIVYLGVSVTISGWIVTYIIAVRGGGPSAGYISAGVSGGIVIGRTGLLWVNKKIGERKAVFLYASICIGLEIIVWRVPSLIGNAVTICIAGIFLGPMYPLAINQATRILPAHILTGAIGWIAGFGQTGSALAPFITGALASRVGLQVMPPFLIGLTALMIVVWALIPNTPYRCA